MPVYWYLNDWNPATGGSGTLITTTASTTATSTCYLTIGGTNITPTYTALYLQPQWVTDGEEAADDAQWLQVRRAGHRPAAHAIIHERSDSERQRHDALIAEQNARRARMAEAGKRARELLLEHLTPEQRRMFEANNWFLVEGGRSREQYRIRAGGYSGNVEIMKNGRATHRLCGHCEHSIPLGDQILAQKLMLEHAEDDFLRIANRSSVAL